MSAPRRIAVMTLDEAVELVGRTVIVRDHASRRIALAVSAAQVSPSGIVAVHGHDGDRFRAIRVELITHDAGPTPEPTPYKKAR